MTTPKIVAAWQQVCWPLVVTVVIWGFNFVSVKLLYAEMTPAAVCLVRYFAMWVTLVAVCRATGNGLRPDPKDWPRLLWAGCLAMGIYMAIFLEGMQGTSPAEGAIILAVAPVVTYIVAVAIRTECFRWSALLGTLCAFLGVAVVSFGAGGHVEGGVWGNLLVLLSAIVWGASPFVMRPMLQKYSPLAAFTMAMPGALPVLIPYGLHDTLRIAWPSLSLTTWANLGQVAFLSGVVAFVGFYKGVQMVGPAVATRYQFFTPVVATFFAWIIFRKTLSPMQWLGVGIVLGGVAITARARMAGLRTSEAPPVESTT